MCADDAANRLIVSSMSSKCGWSVVVVVVVVEEEELELFSSPLPSFANISKERDLDNCRDCSCSVPNKLAMLELPCECCGGGFIINHGHGAIIFTAEDTDQIPPVKSASRTTTSPHRCRPFPASCCRPFPASCSSSARPFQPPPPTITKKKINLQQTITMTHHWSSP